MQVTSLLLPEEIHSLLENNLNAPEKKSDIIAQIILQFDECQGLSNQSCYAREYMPSCLGSIRIMTFDHNGI